MIITIYLMVGRYKGIKKINISQWPWEHKVKVKVTKIISVIGLLQCWYEELRNVAVFSILLHVRRSQIQRFSCYWPIKSLLYNRSQNNIRQFKMLWNKRRCFKLVYQLSFTNISTCTSLKSQQAYPKDLSWGHSFLSSILMTKM